MPIGKNIEKRMRDLGWKAKDLVAACKELDPTTKLQQQHVSVIIKRDSKRSEYVPLLARALKLTDGQLLSGDWSQAAKPSRAVNQPPAPYMAEDTLMWAQQFQRLSPAVKRKWWDLVLLMGDALPDAEVEKFIPRLKDKIPDVQ